MIITPGEIKRNESLRIINACLVEKRLNPALREYLNVFYEHLSTLDVKIGTIEGDVRRGKQILLMTGIPPQEWTENTILEFFEQMTWKDKAKGEKYTPGYRNLFRGTITKMLKHKNNDLQSMVMDSKSHSTLYAIMQYQDIPSPAETIANDEEAKLEPVQIQILQDHILMHRAKIFYEIKADTGARNDDLRMLQLKHVKWTHNRTRITLHIPDDTKTRFRNVRVIDSLPVLKYWFNHEHPFRDLDASGNYIHRNAALFLNSHNKPWGKEAIAKHFRAAVQEIRKKENDPNIDWPYPTLPEKISPKMLRKNRVIRHLESKRRPDLVAAQMGHSLEVMFASYNLINKQAEVEREFDELAGHEPETEEVEEKKWTTCSTCSHINHPGTQFCATCGTPLTDRAQSIEDAKIDARFDELFEKKADEIRSLDKQRG